MRSPEDIKSVGDIYKGVEYDLPELPKDHPVRVELEAELENSVKGAIEEARANNSTWTRKERVLLLLNSLLAKPDQWSNSFALWVSRRGRVIGLWSCYYIGTRVCKEMGFNIREAQRILKKTEWEKPEYPYHVR